MSYCGVNQCPPIPYQDAESWLGHLNQTCTEACFRAEPGMQPHPGRRLRHRPAAAALLERHPGSTVEECTAECQRRTDCAALEMSRDGVCTLVRHPAAAGLLDGLVAEAGSTVVRKTTHDQECAVRSMDELVECTAATEGLAEAERWTDAECTERCAGGYLAGPQCPPQKCRCRRALAPVLRFQDGERRPADLSRMCCQYCAGSAHLGALECSQVAEPAVCEKKDVNLFGPCGLCVSNFDRSLHIPHWEKKLQHHLDRLPRLEAKLQQKQQHEDAARARLAQELRRHPDKSFKVDPATCQASGTRPRDRHGRNLAKRSAAACRHRSRAAHHLRRVNEAIERETASLLQRKQCLAECEPSCHGEQDTHTCAAGQLHCRPGAAGCTEGLCGGTCAKLLGRTPLCSWEGCAKLSQNTCTSSSCDALQRLKCVHCPDPGP
jgi:hypothetical protein